MLFDVPINHIVRTSDTLDTIPSFSPNDETSHFMENELEAARKNNPTFASNLCEASQPDISETYRALPDETLAQANKSVTCRNET